MRQEDLPIIQVIMKTDTHFNQLAFCIYGHTIFKTIILRSNSVYALVKITFSNKNNS